ncbi:LOW QUALITY PROTEIN: hypothetical protein U9M48_012024 [Paspalum notatum var. saurae]|uniref:Uncharacterized protein n=1 Tax=Paspalum notatum var. saurae TaxID=547442 RepID=A0AAQ3SWT1_PASNO
MDTAGNSGSTALKYGAGQLNPAKANDPGLVYDASESNYVAMLCAQGYTAAQLALVTGSSTTACAGDPAAGSPSGLNYPTMTASVKTGKTFAVAFPRTVTNVGAASGVYDVKVLFADAAASFLAVDVSPSKLEFSAVNQKVSFTVTVSGVVTEKDKVYSAAVVWYNDEHEVRSPVVVYTLYKMDGIVTVFPSKTLALQTTRSWDFLGLPQTPPDELPLEGEVIVGMFDTGIWLDSPSFSDDGFGPPPSRWKGVCQNFTCNKYAATRRKESKTFSCCLHLRHFHLSVYACVVASKVIGARAYHDGATGMSPWDEQGHGSHTASTVAGRAVGNVSFDGLGAGTARGAVPGARLAVYKVCWDSACGEMDTLAAFDDAIADGVDVISFSVGSRFPSLYFKSAAAIGSFHAMRRGVVTSAAAGNSGLSGGRVCNVAPWMLAVAASSIDRRLVDRVVLGNGTTVVVKRTETTVNPQAPIPASFSSPGPNQVTPEILKPDLSAPGIDIIASWSLHSPPSDDPDDKRRALYIFQTGTSMACPHASGAAAYVKSFHRDWSPAMIMSALITTVVVSTADNAATPMNTPGNADTNDLKYGAGQLNPAKARDPGLVYDASEGDYVAMLCTQGYNATQLALIIGSNATACAAGNGSATAGSAGDLNYPSMAALVEPGKNFTVVFPRTVTNVGDSAAAVYDVEILPGAGAAEDRLAVAVTPTRLEFSAQNPKASFTVTVSGVVAEAGQVVSAAVVWSDKEHQVRSPVVVYTDSDDDNGKSEATECFYVLLCCSVAPDRIVYSYTRSMNGFAARLTERERQKLSAMDGVVSVFPSRTYRPQTTRSWDFLGFPETARRSLPTEAEVIVGMIDTGVWPASPSFSDDGFSPPPARWKGSCHNFTCNKYVHVRVVVLAGGVGSWLTRAVLTNVRARACSKIIGARAYRQGKTTGLSPVDTAGHGSHTASTAAGRAVESGGVAGLGAGSARGAVPGARIAVYKVCWDDFCRGEDTLAAFDDAVADGVDLISFSIGGTRPAPYFEDAAAVGAFHAMTRGVLTSAAAGNSALQGGRVCNVAPWVLSVAASSTDRRIVDKLVLGNGKTIVSLAGQSYKGKILLCAGGNDGTGPLLAGAAGMVMVNGEPDVASMLPLPALTVTQDHRPVGTIHSAETAFDPDAPVVASFSSRGPNLISPGILKVLKYRLLEEDDDYSQETLNVQVMYMFYPWNLQPDLSAPGIDILAAWTPLSPVSGNNRFPAYNIISGTSMACPHATGAAAYVKSFHPDWSPAMIMSALITTDSSTLTVSRDLTPRSRHLREATPMDPSRSPGGGELAYGAGQLNPERARDPGLVYDAREDDYVRMLCAEGYNSTQLRAVTGSDATVCPAASGGRRGAAADLNYPTMAHHQASPGKNFSVRFPRTVTNVGAPGSVYVAEIVSSGPQYIRVAVAPRRLEFSSLLQKLSFTVTVSGALPAGNQFVSAAVVWSDGVHQVRSPIIVHTVDVE